MITKNHVDALIASKFELLKANEFLNTEKDKILSAIREEMESLTQLASIEVCVDRCNFFNLDKTSPEDYSEKILKLDERNFILAGIRFRGLDVKKPFIGVQISNSIVNESLIYQISELVKKEFAIFSPLAVQLKLPSNYPISMPNMKIDRHTVVGSIENLLAIELNQIKDEIVLKPLHNTNFYDNYLKEYELFHQASPEFKFVVRAESLDDFQEAIKENLLFEIVINGKMGGIIAGSATDYYGVNAAYIVEEILYDPFRGKGFGAYIQKAFTKKLKGRFSLLWGTISDLNYPSLKTALKNGRQVSEIDYFFEF